MRDYSRKKWFHFLWNTVYNKLHYSAGGWWIVSTDYTQSLSEGVRLPLRHMTSPDSKYVDMCIFPHSVPFQESIKM